jgi:hypothetical protein
MTAHWSSECSTLSLSVLDLSCWTKSWNMPLSRTGWSESLLVIASQIAMKFCNSAEISSACRIRSSVWLINPSKDFLLSADVTERPANEYGDLEIEIGRTCLIYLSFLGDSDNFETGAPSTERLQRLRICYPFLEYAAAMWPHHLRHASHQNALKRLMQSSLNLLGSATLWKTWLILQPADIWDNQVQLAFFLCDAVIRSPDAPGWALDSWDIRQTLRKKDQSRSPNSHNKC